MSGDEGLATDVVLGQIATHIEPGACLSCGKSARACGKASSFCCRDCAGAPGEPGTSFLTHEEADRG